MMLPNRFRIVLLAAVCCLAIGGLTVPQYCRGEEDIASLNREERTRINYVMKLETENEINHLFAQPGERLQEQILKSIEEKQGIKIKRSSMVKTDKCLHELLSGIAHLAKISSGHKIKLVVIKLAGATSRASIWSKWEVRKLETPKITITLHYDDPAVEPSEISCQY